MTSRNRIFYGLAALATALAVVAMALFINITTRACSLGVVTREGETWCWEFWLNRYQTLITGIFALIAAAVAWRGVVEQVNVARLPSVTRDGSKVRALRDQAEETDCAIRTAIDGLLNGCQRRVANRAAALPHSEHDIDVARKALDATWIDNDLTDAAAEALRDYAIATIKIGDRVGRIARRSNRLAVRSIIKPVPRAPAIRQRHIEKASEIRDQFAKASDLFFKRLAIERASIARQRAALLDLPPDTRDAPN